MSFVLYFKASPPSAPLKIAMLFDLARYLESLHIKKSIGDAFKSLRDRDATLSTAVWQFVQRNSRSSKSRRAHKLDTHRWQLDRCPQGRKRTFWRPAMTTNTTFTLLSIAFPEDHVPWASACKILRRAARNLSNAFSWSARTASSSFARCSSFRL
jgi:hypothetical protein